MSSPPGPLDEIRRDGSPVAFTTETIKGVQYARFAAAGACVGVLRRLSTYSNG